MDEWLFNKRLNKVWKNKTCFQSPIFSHTWANLKKRYIKFLSFEICIRTSIQGRSQWNWKWGLNADLVKKSMLNPIQLLVYEKVSLLIVIWNLPNGSTSVLKHYHKNKTLWGLSVMLIVLLFLICYYPSWWPIDALRAAQNWVPPLLHSQLNAQT